MIQKRNDQRAEDAGKVGRSNPARHWTRTKVQSRKTEILPVQDAPELKGVRIIEIRDETEEDAV